jgi:hypothetical protein
MKGMFIVESRKTNEKKMSLCTASDNCGNCWTLALGGLMVALQLQHIQKQITGQLTMGLRKHKSRRIGVFA